jgi:hypothetical protein
MNTTRSRCAFTAFHAHGNGLDELISELEPQVQAIIKLLQRGHDQAQYVLKNGELPDDEPAVPWELSHGLSILRIGVPPLPQSPDQLQTKVLKDSTLLGCRKWELLDLLWSEALLKWIETCAITRLPALTRRW